MKIKRTLLAFGLILITIVSILIACTSASNVTSSSSPNVPSAISNVSVANTLTTVGLKAAKWSSNVKITYKGD